MTAVRGTSVKEADNRFAIPFMITFFVGSRTGDALYRPMNLFSMPFGDNSESCVRPLTPKA